MFASRPTSENDQELVRQFQATGDLEVLGTLFTRYQAMVYGVCLKYLRDRDLSRDAAMQVFEKLITTLRQHPVDYFKSWLYVTTRNHCLMYLRSQKGKIRVEISEDIMDSDLVLHLEEEPALEEDLGKLKKCIETLVQAQQQCVRLFFLEEKCYKEIAGVTGFDMNAVKSYIQNGKRNLKICMESHG